MLTLDDFKVLKETKNGNERYKVITLRPNHVTEVDGESVRPQRWPSDIMCMVMSSMISSSGELNMSAIRLPYTIRESMQLCGLTDTQIREILFCSMCKISDNNVSPETKKYSRHLYPVKHL